MFHAKIFFPFTVDVKKIVKRGDAQEGITKKKQINMELQRDNTHNSQLEIFL